MEMWDGDIPPNTTLPAVRKSAAVAELDPQQLYREWKRAKHRWVLSRKKLTWLAATEGNVTVAQYLLSKGHGRNLLLQATHPDRKHDKAAITLIKAGAPLDRVDKVKDTALMNVCYRNNGNIEIARMLIEAGADQNATGRNGLTACERARESGLYEIAKLLGWQPPKVEEKVEAKQQPEGDHWTSNGTTLVTRVVADADSNLTLKYVFNFEAKTMMTMLLGEGGSKHLSTARFHDVDEDFLNLAREKIQTAGVSKDTPAPLPLK